MMNMGTVFQMRQKEKEKEKKHACELTTCDVVNKDEDLAFDEIYRIGFHICLHSYCV